MKKNGFDSTKYRPPRINLGMAGEKLLELIEKYIGLDLLLMILGLLFESNGLRGFPFAWLGRGYADQEKFLLSLLIITALVVAGDVLTRIFIGISEPVTKVQKTLDQYSSTFTGYVDHSVSARSNSSQIPARKNAPSNRTSRSKTSTEYGSLEEKITGEYQKLRKFLGDMDSFDEDDAKTPKVIEQLLNGKKPVIQGDKKDKKNGNKKSSAGLATIIACIAVIIAANGVLSILNSDDNYDSDDEWNNEYLAEDDYEDDYADGDDLCMTYCESYLQDLQAGDTGWFDAIATDDQDTVREFADLSDWESFSYEVIFSAEEPDMDPQSAVYRYKIVCDGELYLAAFRFNADDIANDDPELAGFAMCKYPPEDESYENDFGECHYDEYAEDELEQYEDLIKEDTIMKGDCEIDGVNILLW